jgi:cation diffusion facilitator family transporter
MSPSPVTTRRTIRLGLMGVLISTVVFAVKYAAYRATGSVALLADAIETVINVVAAIVSVTTIWFSAQPADSNHPYGHTKAEYLSALCEGLMMLGAAAVNSREVWQSWVHPVAPESPAVGLGLNIVGGLVNLLWGILLLRYGKQYRSVALTASGRHTLTDVYASAGVVAAFALVPLTGWLRIDACIAAAVTANILWTGLHTLRTSLGGLMDELSDPTILADLTEIIMTHGAGAREAHDLRARLAGRMTFVEFHLVVDAHMTVAVAHCICDRIEHAIREALGPAMISIHLEPPEKAKGAHLGAVNLLGAKSSGTAATL